jgi:hypothetical protein
MRIMTGRCPKAESAAESRQPEARGQRFPIGANTTQSELLVESDSAGAFHVNPKMHGRAAAASQEIKNPSHHLGAETSALLAGKQIDMWVAVRCPSVRGHLIPPKDLPRQNRILRGVSHVCHGMAPSQRRNGAYSSARRSGGPR